MRCEGVIHRDRIVSRPFDLDENGLIPREIYDEMSEALGQNIV